MKTNSFLHLDELPDEKSSPEFWGLITSENFKAVANFLIVNEIRKYPIESLSDSACRVQLARIKAFQEMLDFGKAAINHKSKVEESLSADNIIESYP